VTLANGRARSLRWLVLLTLTCLAVPLPAQERALSPHERLAREIYKQLIEIDTTHDRGSTTRAAEAVAKRLRAAGVPAKDIAILGPTAAKKNLVARLRGTSARKPLLLLAHLDVVEAKREDWSVDPFRLLEQDGFFYGRGSLDDKAMAAVFSAIIIRLRQTHATLDRDVILALTADEEGGPHNGVEWLLHHHRPLVDAAMVINEGGGGRSRGERYVFNGVQASEKTYMNFQLEVRNPGGHSSLPTKENAIYRLAAALGRIERYEFPVELNEVTRNFFERSAAIETGEAAADMQAILRDPPDAAAAARLAQTPMHNATLRTTCIATRLHAGHADNALPQTARALINCRVMPGHSMAEVQQVLAEVIADDPVTITPTERDTSAPASPLDPGLMQVVERITSEMWPGVPVIALMSTGASDSRYFRQAGIPAYGVSGIFVDVDDIRAHGRDERLGVKQFYEGYEFLWRLVTALSLAPAAEGGT
jgi:acetylornithine deacetylase/succinyl-diaminopimelate desuccinylase-like protein